MITCHRSSGYVGDSKIDFSSVFTVSDRQLTLCSICDSLYREWRAEHFAATTHVIFQSWELSFPNTNNFDNQRPCILSTTRGHEILWLNCMVSQKVSLSPSDLCSCMSVVQAIQKTRYIKYACLRGEVTHSTRSSVLCSELHHFRLVDEHIINNRVPHTGFFIEQTILLSNCSA